MLRERRGSGGMITTQCSDHQLASGLRTPWALCVCGRRLVQPAHKRPNGRVVQALVRCPELTTQLLCQSQVEAVIRGGPPKPQRPLERAPRLVIVGPDQPHAEVVDQGKRSSSALRSERSEADCLGERGRDLVAPECRRNEFVASSATCVPEAVVTRPMGASHDRPNAEIGINHEHRIRQEMTSSAPAARSEPVAESFLMSPASSRTRSSRASRSAFTSRMIASVSIGFPPV